MKMKKITALLVCVVMLLQLSFVVNADGDVLYQLDLADAAPGVYDKNTLNTTSSCTVTVVEDEETEEKFLKVADNDASVAGGFTKSGIEASGTVTVSVDIRLHRGRVNAYLTGTGHAVSAIIGAPITFYTKAGGGAVSTSASVPAGSDWVNLTCIMDAASGKFDYYKNGLIVVEDQPFREGAGIDGKFTINMFSNSADAVTEFDIRNLVVYKGEVIPPLTEKIPPKAEKTLVDFKDAPTRLDAVLGNAVAMSIGNSMARVNNGYVAIDPDNKYVAPFITEDGYTLIPTRFTTETIGCDVEVVSSTTFRFSKDGTVMEINMGDKNAVINGQAVEMPTTPVIKYDRLFIPLRFAAETYGKNVFWDDRGLIIISDGEVVKAGQEDIIKPLLSQIRQYTTLYGNRKYSDVNYTSRYFRLDGHTNGTETPQWGTLDAAKRFMATVDRWSYVISGDDVKSLTDQGLLVQGTLNANITDYSVEVASYFLDGTPYTRADGVWGSLWGCLSDPYYQEHIWNRAKSGLDSGLFAWQFDDWPVNSAYRNGGCFCDHCMAAFTEYLSTKVPADRLEAAGVADVQSFNYKEYLKTQGVVKPEQYAGMTTKPIGVLWSEFNNDRMRNFHIDLLKKMEEYAGEKIYYSFNASDTANSIFSSKIYDIVDAVMGETHAANTTAESIYAVMLFTRAMGIENVISPLPKDEGAKELMYPSIPMCYATGQYLLVPWDDWLFGSTRYYATLEELGHLYELPREYPYLFDNYEIPELIGYVYDMDKLSSAVAIGKEMVNKPMPARAIVRGSASSITFDANDFKGLQAVIEGSDLSGLTAEEKAVLENSGVTVIKADDTASVDYINNAYWTVKDKEEDVYTILRQNQLYDNAPTVVHAVNYGSSKESMEIEVNNLYLPAGDTFSVNVYKPGQNMETVTVNKGESSTKIILDSVDKWAVLEISGPATVRREASFYLGEGVNGIGMGTRMSKDKLYGTADNFTLVTYGEGINTTTYKDETGSQDEIAFVYSRLGKGTYRQANVSAGFGEADGAFGVMVREGVYSNARFGAIMYDEANGLRLAVRNDANLGVEYVEISKEKPAYMKLERDGEVYKALTSADGENYTQVGEIELVLDETVGGVFASSPDGSRAQCNVKDFQALKGNFPTGKFTDFSIRYPGGVLSKITEGEKLTIELATEAREGLTTDDVDVEFVSSNENVVKILSDGTIVPVDLGEATITATAYMGLRKISATTKLRIKDVDPLMFEENFDGNKVPDYMKRITAGEINTKDGALTLTAKSVGEECDTSFGFTQYNRPTVFEFDFRAKFGKTSPTTGARVAYIHTMAMSMTADTGGFYWFYGGNQTKVAPIEENKWYHIRIEADYDNQTADVFIDGEQVVEKGETRSAIAPDGSVRFGGWRLGTDTVYQWDNVKFTIK